MHKYFLAILPPEKIATEIVAFQKEIEDEFGAIHAQKTPPHITIIPPFECAPEKLPELTSMLALFLKEKATDDDVIEADRAERTLICIINKMSSTQDYFLSGWGLAVGGCQL